MASPPHIIRQSLGQPEANLSRDEWKLTEQDFCGRQHTKVCSLEPSNERDAIQEGQQLSEGPEATSTDALEDQAPQEQEVHVTESVRHAREQAEIRMKAIFQMVTVLSGHTLHDDGWSARPINHLSLQNPWQPLMHPFSNLGCVMQIDNAMHGMFPIAINATFLHCLCIF